MNFDACLNEFNTTGSSRALLVAGQELGTALRRHMDREERLDRISPIKSNASSVYHGLVVRLDKRFSHHFQFAGSYTWSKVIDDVPDAAGVNPGTGDRRLFSDPSNPRADGAAGIND